MVIWDNLSSHQVSGVHEAIAAHRAMLKAFAQSELSRTKTDQADAKLIARPARKMRQMEQNRLDTADAATAPSIRTLLKTLDQEIKTVHETMQRRIDEDPDLEGRRDLLKSIPGIGNATLAPLLVLFSAHHGFHKARQAVAFVGLAPNPPQSGVIGKTRLATIGNRFLRKALYLPAWVAGRHPPLVRDVCERLEGNGKNGKAIARAAMRRLLPIAFGVLKSGQPFNPNFALA